MGQWLRIRGGSSHAGREGWCQPGVDPEPALRRLDDQVDALTHKLPVIRTEDGQLFEPVGNEPSTHILKPNHTSEDYAGSVINEFFTMRLAAQVNLPTPQVYVHYVPEPVYVIERFDRVMKDGSPTKRRHIIDACQLLNKSRAYWDDVPMTIPHPSAATFAMVTRDTLIEAAQALGIPMRVSERLLRTMVADIQKQVPLLVSAVEKMHGLNPEIRGEDRASEMRVLRSIQHIVIRDMLAKLG